MNMATKNQQLGEVLAESRLRRLSTCELTPTTDSMAQIRQALSIWFYASIRELGDVYHTYIHARTYISIVSVYILLCNLVHMYMCYWIYISLSLSPLVCLFAFMRVSLWSVGSRPRVATSNPHRDPHGLSPKFRMGDARCWVWVSGGACASLPS